MEETASIPPQNTVVEQPTSPPSSSKRKKIIALGLVLGVIVLLIGAFFYFSKKTSTLTTTVLPLPTKTPTSPQSPKIVFASYSTPSVVDPTPSSVDVRAIRSNYTKTEVQSFANYFGLNNPTQDGTVYSFTNTANPDSRAVLLFDGATGMFTYTSFGKKISYTGTPSQQAVKALTAMGIYDSTISCDITYKQSNIPSFTYVECHRDWEKLGAPLISLPGMLNYPEKTLVTSLKPGYVPAASPNNSTIINVSTGQNGKARPNDFNTITFGITKNGSIASIDSTMRVLNSAIPNKTIAGKDFKSKDEVIQELTGKPAEFAFAVPAGSGVAEWGKVFPGNSGKGKIASIDELSLVYLEKLPGTPQSQYDPYYLVKGTALLSSGYSVRYTQAIPATRGVLARVSSEDTLQLDTFTPTVSTPTVVEDNPAPIISTPTPTSATTPEINDPDCSYGVNFNAIPGAGPPNFTLNIPGYGSIIISRQYGAPHTLFAAEIHASNTSLTAARKAILNLIEDQFIINYMAQQRDTQGNKPLELKKYGGLQGLYTAVPFDWGGGTTYNGAIPSPKSKGDPPEKDQLRASFEKRALAIDNGGIETVPDPGFFGPNSLLGTQAGAVETEYLFVTDPGHQGGATYPCYLTGGSPTVFFYPTQKVAISVSTPAQLTYSDPQTTNNTWTMSANPNGTLQMRDGENRDRLYYEFNKAHYSTPVFHTGYIINKNDLPSLVRVIASKLQLTNKEETALLSEFSNASQDISSGSYLKVSPVDEKGIENKLPLMINPRPETTHRIHFVLSSANQGETIQKPILNPLQRRGFTVIELGAYTLD